MTRLDLAPIAAHDPEPVSGPRREAAVLVPVLEREGEHHLVFTKRADHLGEHPGQMSFPGGGVEPEDGDRLETALREANEEIGLPAEEADLVGRLDDIRTVTEYAVSPFVAGVPDLPYEPDEREVAEVVPLSLSGLLDPANFEYETRSHPHYGDIVVHYFHVDGYTVWGATGRILVQLLELATPFEAPVDPGSAVS